MTFRNITLKLFFILAVFLSGAISMEWSRDFIKSSIFYLKSFKYNQSSNQKELMNVVDRRLSTVNYPLLLTEMDMSETSIAKGGGSLEVLCDNLAMLDRTGALYTIEGEKAQKIHQIDNNFAKFSLQFSDGSDKLRAHNFLSSGTEVFFSYTRFDMVDGFSHVVAMHSHDCNTGTISENGTILFERRLTNQQALNTQAAGGSLTLEGDYLYTSFGFVNEKKWANPDFDNVKESGNFGITVKINTITKKAEIFTRGHRNITSIVKRGDDLIATEHAMKGGDEINTLRKGRNYGYPLQTFGTKYSTYAKPIIHPDIAEPNIIEDPIWAFLPSIAPGDSIYLQNSVFERWDDSLIVAGLKSRSIFIGKFRDENIVYMEPIFIGERVRSIVYHNASIYLLTDNSQIIVVQLDKGTFEKNIGGSGLIATSPHLKKCVVCHSLEPSLNESAPHLFGIIDRPIASLDYDYTENFDLYKNDFWTKKLLIEFIQNPDRVVTGTSMPNLGLSRLEAENIFTELLKVK